MGWDDGGNFWWEDSEEREASKTPGAAVHTGQHQSSCLLRGQWGSCWAGAGSGRPWAVLGRLCLSAATELHCRLQCSGPTELPQRKSHFTTKKALCFTTPLETATDPFPAFLSLVFCGRSSVSHVLLSGDSCQLSCAPRAGDCSSNKSFTTVCYSKLQTSLGTKLAKHISLCLLPFLLLWVPIHISRAPQTPLPQHCLTRLRTCQIDSIVLCKTSSRTSKTQKDGPALISTI